MSLYGTLSPRELEQDLDLAKTESEYTMKPREPVCGTCCFWKVRTTNAGTCWVRGVASSLTLENQYCDDHKFRTIIVKKRAPDESELQHLPFE